MDFRHKESELYYDQFALFSVRHHSCHVTLNDPGNKTPLYILSYHNKQIFSIRLLGCYAPFSALFAVRAFVLPSSQPVPSARIHPSGIAHQIAFTPKQGANV